MANLTNLLLVPLPILDNLFLRSQLLLRLLLWLGFSVIILRIIIIVIALGLLPAAILVLLMLVSLLLSHCDLGLDCDLLQVFFFVISS